MELLDEDTIKIGTPLNQDTVVGPSYNNTKLPLKCRHLINQDTFSCPKQCICNRDGGSTVLPLSLLKGSKPTLCFVFNLYTEYCKYTRWVVDWLIFDTLLTSIIMFPQKNTLPCMSTVLLCAEVMKINFSDHMQCKQCSTYKCDDPFPVSSHGICLRSRYTQGCKTHVGVVKKPDF